MGDVIEDLMGKWEDLTVAEQQAVAVQLAGKYQYNNLLALLDNADMYYDQLGASMESLGTINQQQTIYMESLEGKLNAMQSSFEGFLGSVFNADDVKPAIDAVSDLFGLLTQISDSLGGGGTLFRGLLPIMGKAFNTQISRGLTNTLVNLEAQESREAQSDAAMNELRRLGLYDVMDESNRRAVQFAETGQRMVNSMDEEQRSQFNDVKSRIVSASNAYVEATQDLNEIVTKINAASYLMTGNESAIPIRKDGSIDITDFIEQNAFEPSNVLKQDIEDVAGKDYKILSPFMGSKKGIDYLEAAIEDSFSVLDKFEQKDQDISKDVQQLRQSMTLLKSSLVDLNKSGVSDKFKSQITNAISEINSKVNNSVDVTEEGVQHVKNLLVDLRDDIQKTVDAYRTLSNVDVIPSSEALLNANHRKGTAEILRDAAYGEADTFENRLLTQEHISSIISLSSAIGELAFAWSSFQSLGALWSNDDLSLGDKLLQTIMNLALTIPSLLDAYSVLRTTIVKMRSESTKATLGDTAATTANTIATNENTKATFENADSKDASAAATNRDARAQAADTASTAVGNLSDGNDKDGKLIGTLGKSGKKVGENLAKKGASTLLKGAIRGFLPAFIALTIADIIGVAKDAAENARQQQMEEMIDIADASYERYAQASSGYDSLMSLYDEYKDTGEASSEFTSSLRTLGESFEIQETNALLAAGAYDELVSKISSAREEALKDWTGDQNKALNTLAPDANKALREYGEQANSEIWQWGDIIKSARDWVANLYLAYTESDFSQWLSSIFTALSNIATGINEFFSSVVNAPGEIIAGFLGGIADMVYGLGEVINGILPGDDNPLDATAQRIAATAAGFVSDEEYTYSYQDARREAANNAETNHVDTFYDEHEGKLTAEEWANYKQGEWLESEEGKRLSTPITGEFNEEDARNRFYQSIIDEAGLSDIIDVSIFNGDITMDTLRNSLSDEQIQSLNNAFNEKTGQSLITIDDSQTWHRDYEIDRLEAEKSGIISLNDVMDQMIYNYDETETEEANANGKVITTLDTPPEGEDWKSSSDVAITLEDVVNGMSSIAGHYGISIDENGNFSIKDPDSLTEEDLDFIWESIEGSFKGGLTKDQLELARKRFMQAVTNESDQIDEEIARVYEEYSDLTKINPEYAGALEEAANNYVSTEKTTFEEDLASQDADREEQREERLDEVWNAAKDEYTEGLNDAIDADAEVQRQYDTVPTYSESISDFAEANSESGAKTFIEIPESPDSNDTTPTYADGSFSGMLASMTEGMKNSEFREATDALGELAQLMTDLGVEGADSVVALNDAVTSGDTVAMSENLEGAINAMTAFSSEVQEVVNDSTLPFSLRDMAGVLNENLSENISAAQTVYDDTAEYRAAAQKFADEMVADFFTTIEADDNGRVFSPSDTAQGYYQQIADYGVEQGYYSQDDEIYRYIAGLGDAEDALEGLAASAQAAGYSIEAAALTRQNYETSIFGQSAGLDTLGGTISSVVNPDENVDQQYNDVYGALETYAAEAGIDTSQIDLDTVNAIMSTVISSGGDLQKAIDATTSGLFDLSRDFDTYSDEINDVFASGEYEDWNLNDINNRYAETVEQMAQANEDDSGVTGEMFKSIGMDSDIVDVLDEASSRSESLDDAFTLLTNKSFEAQRNIIDLDHAFDSLDYHPQLEAMDDTASAIEDAKDELEGLQSQDGDITLDVEADISEAQDTLDDLYQQYDDQALTLAIDFSGDLIDKADETIEAIEDVNSAISLIGDDYTIDYGDLDELAAVFPELMNSVEDVSDGVITLNQGMVDSAIAASQEEINAAVAGDQAKLQSAADYAGAMADMYRQQATAFTELAMDSATTQQDVDNQKAISSEALTSAQQGMMGDLDQSTYDAMNNTAIYASQAGNAQISASEQATNIQSQNMGIMVSNSAATARAMITNAEAAYNAWASVASAKNGSPSGFKSGGLQTGAALSSGVGGSVSVEQVEQREVSEELENTYGDKASEAQKDAAEQADKYNSIADVYENMEAQLLAAMYQMQGAASSIQTPGSRGTGGSGGGGGGGGGDGDGGDAYEPKQEELQEDEINRYEKVDTALEAIANDLDRIATEQERLTGHELIKNMEDQIDLLMTQIELEEEKLKIQQAEADEYAEELKGYGIQFDEEGFITNYAEIYKQELDKLNAVITQYNNTVTEEGQTALEEVIDQQQEAYDNFNELIEKYDELISSSIKTTIQEIEDAKNSIEDLRIETFQTSIEAVDNIKDIQEALIEFNAVFSGLDSEDPFRAMATSAEMLSKYFDVATTSAEEYYDTLIEKQREIANAEDATEQDKRVANSAIKIYEEALRRAQSGEFQGTTGTGYLDMEQANLDAIMEQIQQFEQTGQSDIFGLDSADMYEVAQTIFESATEMITSYEERVDELREAILDAIDEVAERMEKRMEIFENITDELDHQRSLIEMIYGDKSYNLLDQLYGAVNVNYTAQIDEVQQQIDVWQDLLDNLKEGSDEWKAVHENILEAQSELNDLVESAVENLQTKYQNAINASLDTWVGDLFGGNEEGFGDLDWVAEQWELINRNADQYLDEVQKAYNIQKLQAAYTELLDGSNDLHIQQQISQQMEQQLGYLREKDKLSQYDVAYANAQLEILQKQIALEEAQRNKSQLKLRRDTQGNYSYVYTADEGDVAAAEGDLLDAQNNAYELSKQNMTDVQANALQELQNAYSLISDVWNNANLTMEEKKERTQEIIDSLREYLSGCAEQLSTTETNIINDYMDMFELLTDENKEGMQDVYDQLVQGNLDAFDQIDTRWATSITNWLQHMEDFNTSTDEMFNSLVEAGEEWEEGFAEIGDLIGQDFGNMSDCIQDTIDKTNELSSSTADFINQLRDDTGVIKEYENTLNDYAAKIADVTNEMKTYQNQVNELGNKLTAKEQENADLSSQIQDLEQQLQQAHGQGSGSGSGAGGGTGTGDLSDGIQVGDLAGYNGQYYYDSWGKRPAGSNFAGQTNAVRIDEWSSTAFGGSAGVTGNFGVHISQAGKSTAEGDLGWVSPEQLFETGGWYTGDLPAKGAPAILHKKELVLNRTDTENILSVVQMVRDMNDILKAGLGSSMTTMLNQMASQMSEMPMQELRQDVNIEATFPNVHDAAEIEQAILNLNNEVAQYMYKEKI